ncbi:MAG: AEC family transporter [Pseudomonadota bacterium]
MSGSDALSLFVSALAISLPIFGWLTLGFVLHKVGLLPQTLNDRISLLAFNFGLPLMLCAGAAQVDYSQLNEARYLLAGVSAALITFCLSWSYAGWRGYTDKSRGVFVQAAFRSNLAILGVALSVSAYGQMATALAALPVAIMTVLYNVLAVIVLNRTHGSGAGVKDSLVGILRNPLILGITAGVVLSVLPMRLPSFVAPGGDLLSAFFLPLVLICIGGSMRLGRLLPLEAFSWEASAWRLIASPLIGVLIGLALGVRGEALGVLFLLLATPVAASSHIMVIAYRGDGALAANLIVVTTLLSAVTVTLGIFGLSLLSLVGELR